MQFYQWEECARFAEKRTDAILDGEKDGETEHVQPKSNEEFIEETVAKCTYTLNIVKIKERNAFLVLSSATEGGNSHGIHFSGFIHSHTIGFFDYGQPGIPTDG